MGEKRYHPGSLPEFPSLPHPSPADRRKFHHKLVRFEPQRDTKIDEAKVQIQQNTLFGRKDSTPGRIETTYS